MAKSNWAWKRSIPFGVLGLSLGWATMSSAKPAAPGKMSSQVSSSGSGKNSGGGHGMTLSLPFLVSLDGQAGLRTEFNLGSQATLTAEGSFQPGHERLSDKEIQATGGDSLVTWGREYTLLFGAYSEPARMAGWFYMIGAGYRTLDVRWQRHEQKGADLALNSSMEGEMNANGSEDPSLADYRLKARGGTGHLRAGYRYMGSDWPILWTFQIGLRHFQSTFDDKKDSEGELLGDPIYHRAEYTLQNKLKTAVTGGISLGWAF